VLSMLYVGSGRSFTGVVMFAVFSKVQRPGERVRRAIGCQWLDVFGVL
jgi:hypothetical protein